VTHSSRPLVDKQDVANPNQKNKTTSPRNERVDRTRSVPAPRHTKQKECKVNTGTTVYSKGTSTKNPKLMELTTTCAEKGEAKKAQLSQIQKMRNTNSTPQDAPRKAAATGDVGRGLS